jgi:hypothetical protein
MTAMTRRMHPLAGLLVLVGIGALATTSGTRAAAQPAEATALAGPTASAWALKLTEGPGTEQVGLAQVNAESVPVPGAWGAPLTVEGQSPVQAAASPSASDVSHSGIDWHDPTGSATVQGGYAQATVTASSSEGRAGIGTGSGSSFAVASKYLTWSQQEELTSTVANLNSAVIPALNSRLSALAPVLGLLGVSLPQLQQMSPLALIDVADGDVVTSDAATASSPSYGSAHAQTQLGMVQLLDGFITLTSVRAVADSQSASGDDTGKASAVAGQVQIAGLSVTADEHGITLAGNNLLAREMVQPLLDLLLSELASSGVTVHFDQTSLVGGVEQATALELDVASSAGLLQLSVGNAAAGSGPTSPVATSSAELPAASAEFAGPDVTLPGPVPTTATNPPNGPGAMAQTPAPAQQGSRHGIPAWLGVTLPAAAARALHGAFLLALGGGVGAALLPLVVIESSRRRASRRGVAPGKEDTS